MTRYSSDSFINRTVHQLIAAGFEPFRGARHYRLRSPNGKLTITVPGTPGDRRVTLNWRAQVRRQLRSIGMEPVI